MNEPEPAAEPKAGEIAKEKSAGNAATWKFVAAGVALLLCCARVVVNQASSSPVGHYPELPVSTDAIAPCENAVTYQLKAPSTPLFSDERSVGNDPNWTVTGSVDSQSPSGAMIHNSFECTVTHAGDYLIATAVHLTGSPATGTAAPPSAPG